MEPTLTPLDLKNIELQRLKNELVVEKEIYYTFLGKGSEYGVVLNVTKVKITKLVQLIEGIEQELENFKSANEMTS